jgi:AcrR family transcriptional regulator
MMAEVLPAHEMRVSEAPVYGGAHSGAVPHDGAKRKQILDGARTVFLNDGFDGASMNDIARVAGVSKGTLYVYFDSKEGLFEALIREERQQQAEQMMPAIEPRDAREFLGFYGRRLLELMTRPEMLAQVRLVVAATTKFPRIGQAFYEAGPCYGQRRLAARLSKLTEAGELEIADTELAAQQFAELCKAGIFNRALFCVDVTIGPEEITHRVDAAVEMFMQVYGRKR